ncbi:MAG: M50 family metallopeptidase, partial [Actinomycetota bacterium]
MSGALGIVAFVVTILVMVALHEFGHFVAAKSFGIKVEEFFIGFGPRLFSRRRGETEYGVKALLLGGYVKIAGMNPWQTLPASDLPRTYGAKPAWQRALLLAAGSTTHLVLACVVLALVFGLSGVPEGPTTVLESVFAGPSGGKGPAAEAGIREGDRIVALAGRPISSWEEVRRRVRARPGQTIEVEVVRASRRLSFTVTLEEAKDPSGGAGTIGLLGVIPEISYRRLAPHEAAWEGARTTGLMVGASVRGVGQVFSPGGLRRLVASLTEQGERSTEEPLGLFGG